MYCVYQSIFGKCDWFITCFTKFIKSISLVYKLSSQTLVYVVKFLTLEHILSKWISCEIYPSRNGKLAISKLKSRSS